jgi:DNA-binding CsgD family transcriptional regulator
MRQADVSVSDMAFDEMGIEELLALSRDAGLLDLEELACHGTGAVVQAAVDSRFDHDALSTLEYVDHWTHVAETDGAHLYVIAFTAPNLPESMRERADDLVGTCDPEVDGHGATISLAGEQTDISETIRGYERAGVSPDLRRLGSYEGRTRPVDDLTDRQREVIETAWEMGYYEVPKQVSSEEIAAELDLDPSTVAEHLQRAERNLLGQLL